MIASHNTFTYLKPTKWWMRLINFAARCQSKTIEEQYRAGVRFFDIRIKNLRCVLFPGSINNENNITFNINYGHTFSTYFHPNHITIDSLICKYDDCGFRIVNEGNNNLEDFKRLCDYLIYNYPYCIRECILDRKTWEIYKLGDYPRRRDITMYSQRRLKWLPFRWPWLETKIGKYPRLEEFSRQEIDSKEYLYWLDFI